MNWGKRIIIGMALFMGFILTMVVVMMRQKIDLVEEASSFLAIKQSISSLSLPDVLLRLPSSSSLQVLILVR